MKYYKLIAVLLLCAAVFALFKYYLLPDLGGGVQEDISPTSYVFYGILHCASLLLFFIVWSVKIMTRNANAAMPMDKLIAIIIIIAVWFFLFVPSIARNYQRTHGIKYSVEEPK